MIPLYRLVKRIADRVVYVGRATPYEVLTEFSDRLSEAYATDDVMPRIAQILGQATGASVARVWLLVGDRFTPIASWPPGAPARDPETAEGGLLPSFAPAESPVEVRHQGELLGAFTVEMSANDPMTPGKERLARDLAGRRGWCSGTCG